MRSKNEHLSVLILTETSDTGHSLEQAVGMLGHNPDCNIYQTLSDIQSAIATRAWDVVVIEGCDALENIRISSLESSPIKLRLLRGARAAIIAAGKPGAAVSRQAEWLARALFILWRQVA